MNNLNKYLEQFISFDNPVFFAIIMSIIVIGLINLIYFKIIDPLQKKFAVEQQNFLLEKAELMALFAEMDPEPLIRTDQKGFVIQTNEASRKIFPGIDESEKKIEDILPLLKQNLSKTTFIENIDGKIFSVIAKEYKKLGITNFYLHDITQIKKYEVELEDNKRRLKSLADKLDKQYEELKKSIVAELHDDIGQKLLLIKLKLGHSGECNKKEIQSDLEKIYQSIRQISKTLKSNEINNLGLKLSTQSLVNYIAESCKIKGSFEYLGIEEKLNPEIEICTFRVIQESLNNIIKHSKANEFSVQIELNKKYVNIVISDNGIGIPDEYFTSTELMNNSTGLFSMRERIERLKGELLINSSDKEGTVLVIKLPRGGSINAKNKIAVS